MREWLISSLNRFAHVSHLDDYVRVYPDGLAYYPFPVRIRKKPTREEVCNYLNHEKFYRFCSQFVENKTVGDVGCGSGYGSKILSVSGAKCVYGVDISNHAVKFARNHYSEFARFSRMSATNLEGYPDNIFDVTVCSEVLEHIKDKAHDAICEMKRTTSSGGLIIIGTPNSEMLPSHGFDFYEISSLLKKNFLTFHIFENALVPFGEARGKWEARLAKRHIGIVVTENINIEETVISEGANPELKMGIQPGVLSLGLLRVDTKPLHNTHSWLILAVNNKE